MSRVQGEVLGLVQALEEERRRGAQGQAARLELEVGEGWDQRLGTR